MRPARERRLSPDEVRALKGTRVPVVAGDQHDAIRVAKERPWWTRVKNPATPISEHGRWWFVLADEPLSGLAELARTARTETPADTE